MNLNTSKKRIFFDMHFPEWDGVAHNFAPEEIAREIGGAGVDSVIAYGKCQYGNFYYDTKVGHKHSGLGDQNLLVELGEAFAKRNISTIAYYSVSWDERVSAAHPEWLVENIRGERGNLDYTRWTTLCVNSPYRAVIREQLAEMAELTVLDGFWIDMTIIGNDCCLCPHCLEKYRAETGRDLKRDFHEDREAFKAFRYAYIEEFYKEIYAMLRSINPDLKISNNYWGYPYSSYNMGSRAVGALREADFVTGEAYTDWTGILAPAIFTRFLRAVGGDRPFEALLGRFHNTWDYTRKPALQLALECYTVFSQGGTVTIDDEPYADGSIDTDLYRNDLKPVFAMMDRFAHTIEGKRERFAAIYHSQKSKDREKTEGAFIRRISGSFKLLYDLNLPTDFVFDEALKSPDDLKDFRVLILPGVLEFSSEEAEILKAYAAGGGQIIAFGPCGLPPEIMREWGISAEGTIEEEISYLSLDNHPIPLLVRGECPAYKPLAADMERDGEILSPVKGAAPGAFFHNNLQAPGKESGYPGRLYSPLGSGGFTLFPQPLAYHYAKQPLPPYREMLAGYLKKRELAPRVSLRGSKRPDAALYDQGDEIFLHITVPAGEPQICCGLMDPMEGNFERPYELMEEAHPVSALRVELSLDRRIQAAESLVEKNKIEIHRDGVSDILMIDRIELWDIIRIKVEHHD